MRLIERQDTVAPFAALALGSIGDESAIPVLAAAWRRSANEIFKVFLQQLIAESTAILLPGSCGISYPG